MDRTSALILFLLILPVFMVGGVYAIGPETPVSYIEPDQITEEPINPSNPTNVVIRESAIYDAPVGDQDPIAHFTGVIFWEELAGSPLGFFVNTSLVINSEFRDFETKNPMQIQESCTGAFGFVTNCVEDRGDSYRIVPEGRSFQYEIESYYEPDVIEDTGFIVVFNSQSVDFSIDIDGEPAFARTDYSNIIILPQGAGIVSYAPIDDGFLAPLDKTSDGRFVLEWEYLNREMDSKHDPLMISVTYTYDAIFLAFTEQVYQNQQDQRQQQDQINRLNLIRQSFAVMATLAIILSLFSVFFAYLLARRKFETDLKRAKELPRREVADIETDPPLKVPVRSLFLSAIIIFPLFFSPVMMADGQIIEQDRVIWEGVYDLGRDLELTEYISMEIPTQREFIYVYTDTEIATLTFYDEFGNELAYDTEPNRFKIDNPGLKFNYELERPYTVHNNSNMLVWLDRFWLEFSKPVIDFGDDDPFFNVDMSYSVLLPEDAILYSASPSELLNPIVFDNRRYEISFADTNRRMDAFHDVFETQITFSFIGILDALENLDSDFLQVKPEEPDINSLIQVAAQEVLIFAILGIIAPLISFLIAYWVFRRRYQKMIDRAEREQEEKIFVEGPQIMALSKATASDASERGTDAFMGHYYRGIEFLSTSLGTDVSRFDTPSIVNLVRKGGTSIDVQLLMEFLNLGTSVNPEDVIGYDQVHQINQLVEELIESTKEEEQ